MVGDHTGILGAVVLLLLFYFFDLIIIVEAKDQPYLLALLYMINMNTYINNLNFTCD